MEFKTFSSTIDPKELNGCRTRIKYVLNYMEYIDRLYTHIKNNKVGTYPANASVWAEFSRVVEGQLKQCRKYLRMKKFLCQCSDGKMKLENLVGFVNFENFEDSPEVTNLDDMEIDRR